MSATFDTVETDDGPFTLIADADGRVLASGWTTDLQALRQRIHPDLRPEQIHRGRTAAAEAVRAYYAGDLAAAMAVPVVQQGTELQLQGWRALRDIAPGAPVSYARFAERLGRPRAVRAAASTCARNAVALFVPCHRVLRTDGSLGGFAWGTDVKESLLRREAASR
jgi:methylated-DNA-[protein]-cysteine S-methyltransferase